MLVMAGPEHLDIGMNSKQKNAANILSETIFPKIN